MDQPGLFQRLALALALFWRVLFDGATAARLRGALASDAPPAPALAPPDRAAKPAAPPPAEPAKPAAAPPERAAVQLLAALQREGRFVDFVQEPLGASVSDADIGAAARLVHDGCRKVLGSWFTLEPVWPGAEGQPATVEAGFDPRRVRLTGHVDGQPPYRGTLTHHGWRVAAARLPTLTGAADPSVVMAAEVEV